jgi:ethanolamine permease
VLGALALVSGRTSELITMSALGAIVMYIVSMLSLFRLRRTEPRLARPFASPLYPLTPLLALLLSMLSLAVIVYFNALIAVIFACGLAGACLYSRVTAAQRASAAPDALLQGGRPRGAP